MKPVAVLFGCLLGVVSRGGAQSMVVHTHDGSAHEFNIADIESITFSELSGYQSYSYDFESAGLDGWGGSATAEIVSGTLHLSGINGYLYHPIASSGTHFTRGTVEFDIKPGSGDYVFQTKGETEGSGTLSWAVYMRWRNSTIQIHQWDGMTQNLIDTGVPYEENMWYHIRILFDKDQGAKGRFSLWSRPLEDGSAEVFVGEYDYEAEYGKMAGVNQISLGVYDIKLSTTQYVYFDNFYFHVAP